MTTILVVDDEYLIADILGYALEDEGFMVVKASNGQKGLEFAKAVRALSSVHHLPIILISGAQAHIGMQRSDLFNAVLEKPFNIHSSSEIGWRNPIKLPSISVLMGGR